MLEIKRFKELVDGFYNKLLQTQEEIANVKLSEDKWSLKEIIGHLIDSASNNHQRFVRLQFDDLLDFPAYDGEKWVEVQKYNRMKWNSLVSLWYNYNCLLINIIENIDIAVSEYIWVKDEEALTLEFLINDYYRHLEFHICYFEERLKEVVG